MFLYEIIKNLFLKDILKSIFNLLSTRFIKTFCICVVSITSLALFTYLFKLEEDRKSGREHFEYSKFIERDIVKKMNNTIDRLFNQRKEGQELSYLFLSFIEIEFVENQCTFRWKHIVGFNEGTKKSFDDVTKANNNYKSFIKHPCHKNDTLEKIKEKSNTKIKAVVNRKHGLFGLEDNLLSTQIQWLANGYAHYQVKNITYYIKGYKTENRFYMIQIASLKQLHQIIKDENSFNTSINDIISSIRRITKPRNPLMYFNK